jgi:hypothetical protein
MIKVFEPFEVRNSNTANVGEQIWDNLHSSFLKNLVASESRWTICTFDNNLGLNVRSRMSVNDAIYGTGCKDIALLSHHIQWVGGLDLLSIGESVDIARLMLMHLQIVWIDALATINSRVFFDDSNDFCTLSVTVFGKIITYISETLDNDFLTSDS